MTAPMTKRQIMEAYDRGVVPIWYGTPGHFICARWCRFHLCTEVGPYLVSTVGEYIHPRHSGGSEATEQKYLKENWPGEEIGCDRKYETMVFRTTGKRCEAQDCGCGLPEIDASEIDFDGYNSRGDAHRGHHKMVAKYTRLVDRGEIQEGVRRCRGGR